DIRKASLGAVQRAWARGFTSRHPLRRPRREDTPNPMVGAGLSAGQRKRARQAMLKLFVRLYTDCQPGSAEQAEVKRIVQWLYLMATPPKEKRGEAFLSGEELDAVIKYCLKDIGAGVRFTKGLSDPVGLNRRLRGANDAT